MKLIIDPGKALAELALIFIGITLALAFENWNTDKERRDQELTLLGELLADLQETQSDLQSDISQAEKILKQTEQILRWYSGDDSFTDAIRDLGSVCFSGHELFATTTTYESIKTIGMDLIRNDLIRTKTAQIFEQSLERVYMSENRLFALNLDYCWPLAYSNAGFTERSTFESGVAFPERAGGIQALTRLPRPQLTNLDELRNDAYSRALITQNYDYRLRTIGFYKMAEEAISELISSIETELAN